ncbi:hypothetical protein RHS01_05292 [Rhizoctonia solani]|uniref:Uncharacterized protein n=1 Tax=Rhizoctonia solani TaxID=456999 RepID=A0A8H7IE67_9AGAM|nr:hypothetical protein RHS01_05292 [Rhizoctonia solani]
MSAHSTPGKAPKRLTLTPGPRPLHLGTGNALGSPLASAPLPRRMGSVAYGRDDMRWGRRGRGHASTSSIGASEGVLERAQREAIERKRRSASALDDKDDRDQPPPAQGSLHFIAQKEAKCVELRSQLATHEADLLQLKKKWEKIVAKGNDRQASRASAGNGAVDLVRGIFGLGEIAYTSSPSPVKGNRPPLTPASRGHLSHTPHSSISTATSTRYSLSSVSSFAGVEQLKEKDEPRVVDAEDDDPDAWGPFETAEPEPIRLSGPAMSALGLSGVEKIGERRTSLANKRASSFMSDSFPSLSRQNSTPIRASPTPPMKLTSPRSKKPSVSPISTSHSTPAQRISSVSLIDDDDGTSATLGAVLQPSTSTTHNAQLASDAASVNTANDAFGEDWNW